MIITKIPSSSGSLNRNKGCEKAPDMILNELRNIEINESFREIKYEVSEVKISSDNPDETNRNIENARGDIFIGGDHSITYSLFKSMKSKSKGLIIFDAHLDLDNYTKTPTHEDYLKKLIDEKILNPKSLIIIGARKFWKNEMEYARKNSIKILTPKNLSNLSYVCESVMESFRDFDELYISIDIDVLDPSIVKGTYYTEPNGLTLRQLLFFLNKLKLLKNVSKVDLVEANPDIEEELTIKTCAKIISELL